VVLLEDLAALIGLVFALFGVGLTLITGNGTWDGIGTALIGLLLVAVAMRLLALRPMPARIKVADLLPALVTAPLLTAVVVAFR
jgi:uncharacterized membrane protein YqgA involved in biofilm formation